MPDVRDYTYMWWAHGWRSPKKVLAFQTGYYALAVDVPPVRLLNLGAIASPKPAAEAAAQDNGVVFSLSKADLALKVRAGGVWYACKGTEAPASRIIESGRLVQRADIERLFFADASGRRLNAAGRLEIIAWPDRLTFMLEVTPNAPYAKAALSIELALPGGKTLKSELPEQPWPAETKQVVALCLAPPAGTKDQWRQMGDQPPAGQVKVSDMGSGKEVTVAYDAARQWHYIPMPQAAWKERAGDRLDRFTVRLVNPTNHPQEFRLLFARDGAVPGITGLTPILRDTQGNPTGIPVQISKNWHRKAGQTLLYEGPWLHAFTMIRLPPGKSLHCELAITYAYWGGVPAVSHAQLCLIGWGTDQLWDQSAIGSWGESICYDPDVNLQRGMIDDVRPLMVWGMNGGRPKWAWTHNVGGGDFADYHPDGRDRAFFARMRTNYRQHGPCLTDVTYAGVSPDGAVSMRATVSTPRCDDIVRAYYHVRYDFHKAVSPKRLELFRLGADRYNDPDASRIAWGAGSKLIREVPSAKREGYQTTFPLQGPGSWVAMYASANLPKDGGAWANRGMILRAWKARVGGKNADDQKGAIIGTSQGLHASAALLAPSNDFRHGDFIEFTVEMVVLPVMADDYYGPNDNLRASLKETGDSWKPVARQAAGNALDVKLASGTLQRAYPIQIKVDAGQSAVFEVTGGLGYVPLTFTGLTGYKGYALWMTVDGKETRVDQSVHGADFWQTDYDEDSKTWRQTYNVSLDSPRDRRRTVKFAFRPIKD
ncbi:MAG TPA: hypothetical protein VM098_03720 [Phycisphaerae bacterium]|nr:hypothetical protein [Phycisphaerae bacterium]